jgi:catechol 2,3-dioxygenase-like lactoylglutathione lyase family enzyme
MLANSRLIAFGVTTDARRARAFYEGTLGLQFISEDQFAIVYDVNGVRLRIQKVAHYIPQPFTVLGWSVRSIDGTVSQLMARGVNFERYPALDRIRAESGNRPQGRRSFG